MVSIAVSVSILTSGAAKKAPMRAVLIAPLIVMNNVIGKRKRGSWRRLKRASEEKATSGVKIWPVRGNIVPKDCRERHKRKTDV